MIGAVGAHCEVIGGAIVQVAQGVLQLVADVDAVSVVGTGGPVVQFVTGHVGVLGSVPGERYFPGPGAAQSEDKAEKHE